MLNCTSPSSGVPNHALPVRTGPRPIPSAPVQAVPTHVPIPCRPNPARIVHTSSEPVPTLLQQSVPFPCSPLQGWTRAYSAGTIPCMLSSYFSLPVQDWTNPYRVRASPTSPLQAGLRCDEPRAQLARDPCSPNCRTPPLPLPVRNVPYLTAPAPAAPFQSRACRPKAAPSRAIRLYLNSPAPVLAQPIPSHPRACRTGAHLVPAEPSHPHSRATRVCPTSCLPNSTRPLPCQPSAAEPRSGLPCCAPSGPVPASTSRTRAGQHQPSRTPPVHTEKPYARPLGTR